MSKLKEFFRFWFIFTVITLVFALYIWTIITAAEHYGLGIGLLICIIGVGGFISAATTYLDV